MTESKPIDIMAAFQGPPPNTLELACGQLEAAARHAGELRDGDRQAPPIETTINRTAEALYFLVQHAKNTAPGAMLPELNQLSVALAAQFAPIHGPVAGNGQKHA